MPYITRINAKAPLLYNSQVYCEDTRQWVQCEIGKYGTRYETDEEAAQVCVDHGLVDVMIWSEPQLEDMLRECDDCPPGLD